MTVYTLMQTTPKILEKEYGPVLECKNHGKQCGSLYAPLETCALVNLEPNPGG